MLPSCVSTFWYHFLHTYHVWALCHYYKRRNYDLMDFITKCGHEKDMFGKLHGVISYSGSLNLESWWHGPSVFCLSLYDCGATHISKVSLWTHKMLWIDQEVQPLPLMQASPLTYTVYPWFMHCKCALMQINYIHFQDRNNIFKLLKSVTYKM